jgi:hypothetical protein
LAREGDLGIYPNRDAMLKDLTTHHKLKGLSYKQLVETIGEPEGFTNTKANAVYYNITPLTEKTSTRFILKI